MSRRILRLFLRLALVALIPFGAAHAQAKNELLSVSKDEKRWGELCTRRANSRHLDEIKVLSVVLRGVSFIGLDADKNGAVTIQEMIEGATDASFCLNRCTKDDASAQLKAVMWLAEWIDWVAEQDRNSVSDRPYTIAPSLGRRTAKEFFTPSIVKVCRALQDDETRVSTSGDGFSQEESQKPKDIVTSEFRLRGNVDNLAVKRTARNDQKTVAGSFSVQSDLHNDKKEYQSNVVAGVAFEGYLTRSADEDKGDIPFVLIPYMAFNREFTTGSGASEGSKEVNKIGVGLRGDISIPLFPGSDLFDSWRFSRQSLSLRPQITTDSEADSLITSGEFVWTPTFSHTDSVADARIPFGRFAWIEGLGVGAQLDLDARFRFGHVFDDGGNAALQDSNNYARLGTKLGLTFRGIPNTLLERVQLRNDYLFLHGFSGSHETITRFESALTYDLTATGNFGIGLEYQNGRKDITLSDVEFWKATLNAKF